MLTSSNERAGVPMLPVVAGAKATRRQIVIYTVILAAVSLLPWIMQQAGLYRSEPTESTLNALSAKWKATPDLTIKPERGRLSFFRKEQGDRPCALNCCRTPGCTRCC